MKEQEAVQIFRRESSHYKGAAGSRYFDWQNKNGPIHGKIEARKFRPYIKPEDVVLDFGCGGGHILQNLNCKRRIGVEISPIARNAAIRAGIECHDSIASVDDNSINVVISNHALEHAPFPISILSSIRNKLLASGVLVLCVPIDDWRTQLTYDSGDINHHLHTWTPQLLGNSLFEAGFDPSLFGLHLMTHAWFPGTAQVYDKFPDFIFDRLCQVFAVLTKRRQLLAVARKFPQS